MRCAKVLPLALAAALIVGCGGNAPSDQELREEITVHVVEPLIGYMADRLIALQGMAAFMDREERIGIVRAAAISEGRIEQWELTIMAAVRELPKPHDEEARLAHYEKQLRHYQREYERRLEASGQ